MNLALGVLAVVGVLAIAVVVGCWLAKHEPLPPSEPPCADPECCEIGRAAAAAKQQRHDENVEQMRLTMSEWRRRWDEQKKTGGVR